MVIIKTVVDVSRYNEPNMIQFKYMIIRIDNGFDTKETFDKIFVLCEESYFANDINYVITNSIINKRIVFYKIFMEIVNRGLNHLLEDLGGLHFE